MKEIQEARSSDPLLEEILDRMTEGVLVLGSDLKPSLANPAAAEMLNLSDPLPSRLPSEEIVALAAQARDSNTETEAVINLFFPTESSLQVRVAPLDDRQLLVTLRDVTQEVLAQKVRKEFVTHASHELKSPVASLQALAEAVQQALEDDPEAAAKFTTRLVTESDRLGRLVTDLLDLSRLEEVGSAADDPVDVGSIAAREVAQARDSAAAKDVDLDGSVSDGVWTRGDDQQISLLIRNLLDNAIRYTGSGGHVTIEVTSSGSEVVIFVRDDGIGIPRDAQGRVFERFYRVDRARTRERGGTGLGLAIVKHVAELHGGTVEVQSELGQGSTFIARLPLLSTPTKVTSIAG